MALDRLCAQIQGFSNLSCAKSRTEQLENVDLPVGQTFDAGVVALTLVAVFPRCFEQFLEGEHGDFPAHINFAAHNFADCREQLFVRCVLHQITAGASAQRTLGEKSFLKLENTRIRRSRYCALSALINSKVSPVPSCKPSKIRSGLQP